MKKYIYLLKNIGLLTIGSFASKLLSFFLVPLYTSILTTRDYGIYDIFNTTILLLTPILTAGIIEALLRFPLTNRKDKDIIFLVGMKYFWIGFFLLLIVCFINYFWTFNSILKQYTVLFIALYFTSTLAQILQTYARGIEMVAALAISGIVSSVVIIVLNIWFLVYLRLGLYGYFLANILGMLAAIIYLFISLNIWKIKPFSKRNDEKLEKDMLKYGFPTIANSISWWVNNAADRYIIINLFGFAANGIYSVSYKIPSIMNVFQNIFNQAWSISAVQEFDSNDTSGFYKNIYIFTNVFMGMICSILIMTTKTFAHFLYRDQFYTAWKYVPFLLISVLFGSLVGILGGIFIAVKDSKRLGISTTIGAITNIFFGITLSIILGPIGAALGTTISYIIVWIMRIIDVKKYIKLELNLCRDIVTYCIIGMQSVLLIYTNLGNTVQAMLFIIIIVINYKEIMSLIGILRKKSF